jgi:hypothetical protein
VPLSLLDNRHIRMELPHVLAQLVERTAVGTLDTSSYGAHGRPVDANAQPF